MTPASAAKDRRSKQRFEIQRELRYKVTGDSIPQTTGAGRTINVCSEGVAFLAEQPLPEGAFIEMSINWPVLLGESCPMRLNAFGRILRSNGLAVACTIDKYEFRTAPRVLQPATPIRSDRMLQRWADGTRKVLKMTVA
ncbi:MAG: hypothetical protein KGN36_13490 [Acidobacteriota bacterium]|nr:hypothetical protein [Acidobacteriota bacterium]